MPWFWFEQAPLWIIWPTLSLALLGAIAVGYYGVRFVRKEDSSDESADSHGVLLSAAMALLGLLIAFTFSMASSRLDARRVALLQEANAVGTTYLRFQTADEPYRGELSAALLSYLGAREAFFAAGADHYAVERADTATGAVETRMWTTLMEWIRKHPGDTVNVSLLQATNDMFDLAASDRVVREARVPLTIVRALAAYALIAAFMLGQNLAGKRDSHLLAASVVFVLVALAFALILDIDRPASGTITVSSVPFDRAAASIRVMEAATLARPDK